MMFQVGQKVRTYGGYNGTVIHVSSETDNDFPYLVRMDNGIDESYCTENSLLPAEEPNDILKELLK